MNINLVSPVVFSLAALGLIPAVWVMTTGRELSLSLPWAVPFGTFALRLDPLSAGFLLPVLIISALAGVYAVPYINSSPGEKPVGVFWFFYGLLALGMTLVVLAANAVLFLFAWELMSWASFFLVIFDDKVKDVRRAAWIYLCATHVGLLLIIVVFLALGGQVIALDFAPLVSAAHPCAGAGQGLGAAALLNPGLNNPFLIPTSVIFVLALVGFGLKAGFVPLHIWLPEAHPAAPSPVSALMSGVMIKIGIYGFLRVLTWLGPTENWWGWLLIGLGILSGIWGISFAAAQSDFKRLLAYSSVENIGIILMGLGVGLLGMSAQLPLLATLGITAALFHVYSHSVGKGLLFLSAGAVAHATGTREIDRLGGLFKKMPLTGRNFLIGALGVSGLPPFPGFLGELLLYLACFYGLSSTAAVAIPCLCVIACLALLGTLATFCLSGLFGIAFLGEPRAGKNSAAHEAEQGMTAPQTALSCLLILMALFAPLILVGLAHTTALITGMSHEEILSNLAVGILALRWVTFTTVCLLALALVLLSARFLLQSDRPRREEVTWDCGFAWPTPRMQYTFASLMQPLSKFLSYPLGLTAKTPVIRSLFPRPLVFSAVARDWFSKTAFGGAYEFLTRTCTRFHRFQHGRLQFYILYIALTLLILLIWKLA